MNGLLVVTLKFYMEFSKGQFWVPYFSISISVTHFLTKAMQLRLKILILKLALKTKC